MGNDKDLERAEASLQILIIILRTSQMGRNGDLRLTWGLLLTEMAASKPGEIITVGMNAFKNQ